MSAGAVAATAAGCVLVLAAMLFVVGLRHATRGVWTRWRLAWRARPLQLVVTARSEHGAYVQLVLRRCWPGRAVPLPRFQAGMYLALQVPAGTRGTLVTRRYSLAAWHKTPWHYELAIKREPGGLVSNWIADHLHVGSRVLSQRPAGDFVLPQTTAGEQVLVGAGIGITPLRAMLQQWVAGASGRRKPLTLLWSVRCEAELMDYGTPLQVLARSHADFRYVATLTGDSPSWLGERGRIDAQRVAAWQQTREPAGLWMCASAPMMATVRDGLVCQGMDPARIHHEAFGAAANADAKDYVVTLQPSGRRLDFQGQPSLLAMLTSAGEPVASDCRNGTCGACRMGLVAGAVRQVITPEWPLASDELLACCSVPASDLSLSTLSG